LGWLVVGILALLALAAVTPVRIAVYYSRVGENDHLVVEVSAWFRLIRRKFELPVLLLKPTRQGPELKAKVEKVQQQSGMDESIQDINFKQVKQWRKKYQDLLKRVHDLQPVARAFFRKIRCSRLEWHTVLGTGGAAETGTLLGLVWGVKSMLVSVFSGAVSLRSMPRLSVQPVWNQPVIRTQFRCILHFWLGHAMLAGVRLLLRWRKGRQREWQSAPSEA
jgi:cell division protein FtsB